MLYLVVAFGMACLYLIWQLHRRDATVRQLTHLLTEQAHAGAELLDRAHKRQEEAASVTAKNYERERQLLINRIIDPEFAVGQAAAMGMAPITPEPQKPYVGFEDDADYWRGQREMAGEVE